MITRNGFVVIAPDGRIRTDGFEHAEDSLPGSCREAGIEHMRWAIEQLGAHGVHLPLSGESRLALAQDFRLPDAGYVVIGPNGQVATDGADRSVDWAVAQLEVGIQRALQPPYREQTCGADLSAQSWTALAADFGVEIPEDVSWWFDRGPGGIILANPIRAPREDS